MRWPPALSDPKLKGLWVYVKVGGGFIYCQNRFHQGVILSKTVVPNFLVAFLEKAGMVPVTAVTETRGFRLRYLVLNCGIQTAASGNTGFSAFLEAFLAVGY